jgi:hypothetical protein
MESTPLIRTSSDGEPVHRRASCRVTIEPVIFLFFMYYSGSMSLVSQFVHRRLESQQSQPVHCAAGSVQSEASKWLMYMNIAATVSPLSCT